MMAISEHTEVSGHVTTRRRHEGAQPGDELVGAHVGMGGATAPGGLEVDAHAAIGERLDGVVLPDARLGGRAKVEWLSTELRRVLIAHPRLLPALTASPLLGPNAVRGARNGLSNLLQAGFAPHIAVPAYLAMIDFVLGTVYFDTSRAGQNSSTLPINGDGFLRPSAAEVFEFGLHTVLDGLVHRLAPAGDDRT